MEDEGYTRLKGPLMKGCSVCTYIESESTLSHLIMSQLSEEERKLRRLPSMRAAVRRCRDRQRAIAASQPTIPSITAHPLSLSPRPSPPVVCVSSDSHSSASSSSSAPSASSASPESDEDYDWKAVKDMRGDENDMDSIEFKLEWLDKRRDGTPSRTRG